MGHMSRSTGAYALWERIERRYPWAMSPRGEPLRLARAGVFAAAGAALTALLALIACVSATTAPRATSSYHKSVDARTYAFAGCRVYTPNDWFTTNLISGGSSYVSNAVDRRSAAIIQNFATAFPRLAFNINGTAKTVSQHPVVNIATNETPKRPVEGLAYGFADDPYKDEPREQMPWNSSFIEPSNCASDDCHNVVLNVDTCVDYESYGYGEPSWTGLSYRASAVFVHNLHHPFNEQYAQNGGLVTKAGLPYLGTADFGEDALLSAIPHILLLGIPGSDAASKAAGGYVAPASAGAVCVSFCTNKLPFGARLRLNRNKFTCPRAASYPQAHKICVQLQTYGAIVTDHNGTSDVFTTQLSPTSNGSNPWDESDVSQLNGIPMSDFDVMRLGTIR
jgi:hypothetical protein